MIIMIGPQKILVIIGIEDMEGEDLEGEFREMSLEIDYSEDKGLEEVPEKTDPKGIDEVVLGVEGIELVEGLWR